MHPEAYHKDYVPEQRRKACWDYEEKVLLARGEITMLEVGIGGSSSIQLAPLEHMTVGWTGVTPLKPKPPSVHYRCYPRLHKNSLRSGLSGPKQMTLLSSEGGQMP